MEKRLRVGVVVADSWSGERPEYPKLLQSGFKGGGPHGVAVIGMEDQRLVSADIENWTSQFSMSADIAKSHRQYLDLDLPVMALSEHLQHLAVVAIEEASLTDLDF